MEIPQLVGQATQLARLAPVIPMPVDIVAVRSRDVTYQNQALPLVVTNQLAAGTIRLGGTTGSTAVLNATIEHLGPPPYPPSTVQMQVRATANRTKPDGSPQPAISRVVDALNLYEREDPTIIELAAALHMFNDLPWKPITAAMQTGRFSARLQAARDLTGVMNAATEQADQTTTTYEPVLAWGRSAAIGRFMVAVHTVMTDQPETPDQPGRTVQTHLSVETIDSRLETIVESDNQIVTAKRIRRIKPVYPQLDDRYMFRLTKAPSLAAPIGRGGINYAEAPVLINQLLQHLDTDSATTDRTAFFNYSPQ